MSTLIALLTGGGLVAAGAVINGVVTGLLNSRAAREARKQDRLDKAYIELASTCRASATGRGRCSRSGGFPLRPIRCLRRTDGT